MAEGFEDIESSSIEKKPVLKDSSKVVNGQYIQPTLERYDTNKNIAKAKPVKCKGAGNCKTPAVIRPDFYEGGPKDLCINHWDKVKSTIGVYKPGPMWIENDPELHKEIRIENAKEKQRARGRDAAAIFDVTGKEVKVQGPGRPTKVEGEDPVTTVIDRAASGGGHIGKDHEQKLYAAHQALLSSMDAGGGVPDPVEYHRLAKQSLPDVNERNEYFIHAMNHHKKIMGRQSVVPVADPRIAAGEDFNRNYEDPADAQKYDETVDLMGDSAPSRRDVGLRGAERND